MRQFVLIVSVLTLCVPVSIKAQTCGSVNIAQGKSVNVRNQWLYGPASDAVDGNTGTAWSNDPDHKFDTSYLYVDLAQSYTVCKVKIAWAENNWAKDFLIQSSTDATNWTTIYTKTNNSVGTDSFNVIGTGRYIRVYMTAKYLTWSGYAISELSVYNSLSNYSPAVSLTAPAAGYKTFAGNNITLTASASDADGSISKVAFYQDTVKLGEVTTPPYEFTWSNVQAGQYTLRARAYDNSNADSLSLPVNITVNTSRLWSINGNSGTSPDSNFVGTTDNKKLIFKTNGTKKMSILPNGFVGIGVDSIADDSAKLGVNGTIYARKLKINQSTWADYVFEKSYRLMPLNELESFIQQNKHLPEIATTAQVKQNGTDVAEIQEKLLRKIEELTLYIIEQNKKLDRQQKQIYQLQRNSRYR